MDCLYFKLAMKKQVSSGGQAVASTVWPVDRGLLAGNHRWKCHDGVQPLFLAGFLSSALVDSCCPLVSINKTCSLQACLAG